MVGGCKGVLLLTMFDYYDNKKLDPLRFYDDKRLQYQLQPGPMVCGITVIKLITSLGCLALGKRKEKRKTGFNEGR